ncbi:hypothetical protein N9Z12_04450, partial [Opitutaceae bacterium]|nr:hypothetical protein [Opitutaceae bacterium]
MKTSAFIFLLGVAVTQLAAQLVATLISNMPLIGDGMDVAPDGTLYIASGSQGAEIWKVTPDLEITEFAAGFIYAVGIVIDEDGNVFANNYGSGELSKITPNGVKSAFATGLDGPAGLAIDSNGFIYVTEYGADGSGTGAQITRFSPTGEREIFVSGAPLANVIGIAIDESDNVYATNFTGGQVFRIPAGTRTIEQFATIPGNAAINQITYGHGYVYIPSVSTNLIYRIDLAGNVEKYAGSGARGSIDDAVSRATFNRPNSIAVSAAGDKVYIIDQNTNDLRVISHIGTPPSKLVNLSVRANAGSAENTLVLGYVGSPGTAGDPPLLVRAIGPTLNNFGLTGFAPDPMLESFFDGASVQSNEAWGDSSQATLIGSTFNTVGAFSLDASSRDAAIFDPLRSGLNSVHITDTVSGIALGEIYTQPEFTGNLLNLSCRTLAGDGNAKVIGGFVLGGDRPERLLIRAVGPELVNYGVTTALSNPQVELFSGETSLTTNSRWGAGIGESRMRSYFDLTGAFPLTSGSADAAIVVDLEPGAYTAVVS